MRSPSTNTVGAREPRAEDSEPVKGSLTVVGTGLQVAAHTTAEALSFIRGADKLFYLVADGATEGWLQSLNDTAESLADSYAEGKPLDATYSEAADRILAPVERGLEVCAAFYGHPGVLCTPSRRAIRRARRAGYAAQMLPGISALDCLFSDLSVDLGNEGCQVFVATSFLIRKPAFEPASHLVLMQVGLLGGTVYKKASLWSRQGLEVLARALEKTYSPNHEVVVYEAARFPVCDPVVLRVPLRELPMADVNIRSTLYVPPSARLPVHPERLQALDMSPDYGESEV